MGVDLKSLASMVTPDADAAVEVGSRLRVPDPLDDDAPLDDVVLTTRRGLCRVALVAAETGGRFQREGIEHDPMSWMLSPRAMFDGAAPLDACLDRDACMSAVLVHGLGLGLDATPEALAVLISDDDDPFADDPHEIRNEYAAAKYGLRMRRRLYTATIGVVGGNIILQAFHASVARNRSEIVRRLTARYGAEVAASADIRIGFHPANPLTVALVPGSVVEVIRRVEDQGGAPMNRRFAVDLEHRIEA